MHPASRVIVFAGILLQGNIGLAQQPPADSPPAATQPVAEAADLFAPPVALVDQDGKVIITRRSIGHPLPYDLDGDGCMDVVYTGGVFTKGDETKLWVLYGKTKNMPAERVQESEHGQRRQ